VRIWNPHPIKVRSVRLRRPVGTEIHTLTGHTNAVTALADAPDGSWLASAGYDETVRIWDPATGTATHTLTGHTDPVTALTAAPDGSWLASASSDHTVRIWDPATGTETHTLTGHTDTVEALAAAPDGSWLASASSDHTVRIWNPATGTDAAAALRVDGALTALAVINVDALVTAGHHGPYWLRLSNVEPRHRRYSTARPTDFSPIRRR